MTGRLAVITAQIGNPSETFIRRHIEDLAPGRTVVVARNSGGGTFWTAPGSVFYVDRWALRPQVRLAQRMGASLAGMRERAVARFLRRHHVSVVLGEYLHQFVDFVPVLDRLRLPYIVQGHGIDLSAALREPGMAERYLTYGTARAILTRCDFHRRRLIELGLAPDRVHVNPGGVDVPDEPLARSLQASRRFLAVGRMVAKKGPLYLLEAFRLAAANDPLISIDIVGDGPLLPAARQFVDAAGLDARVRLHGTAPDEVKNRLFRECGVFVQHSVTDPDTGDEEGLPAAIQEAMSHSMAVISTRHSGIPEAVDHGVTGWIVNERAVAEMSRAMIHAANSPEETSAAGRAGHRRALDSYSWESERARILRHMLPRQSFAV